MLDHLAVYGNIAAKFVRAYTGRWRACKTAPFSRSGHSGRAGHRLLCGWSVRANRPQQFLRQPHGSRDTRAAEFAPHRSLRSQDARRRTLHEGASKREDPLQIARRSEGKWRAGRRAQRQFQARALYGSRHEETRTHAEPVRAMRPSMQEGRDEPFIHVEAARDPERVVFQGYSSGRHARRSWPTRRVSASPTAVRLRALQRLASRAEDHGDLHLTGTRMMEITYRAIARPLSARLRPALPGGARVVAGDAVSSSLVAGH